MISCLMHTVNLGLLKNKARGLSMNGKKPQEGITETRIRIRISKMNMIAIGRIKKRRYFIVPVKMQR